MIEPLEVLIRLGAGVLVLLVVLVISLLLKGLDRRFAAWLQARWGPPLLQPFYDIAKLWQKENIIPERAVPWAFNGAPVLALAGALALLFFIPIGPISVEGLGLWDGLNPILGGYGDLILVIYLMAIPGLMMAVGGFASGSPLATVGAQREMVMMMSYELPLAVVILAMAWRLSHADGSLLVFSMSDLSENPVWNEVGIAGFFGLLVLAAVFFLIIPSELSKVPFDAPEAETEIGGGIMAEYSGNNLSMFYIADAVKTVAFTALAVAIFFPYDLSPVFGITEWPALVVDMLFWLFKIEVLYFVSVTVIRVGAARLKIDKLSWFYLVPLSVLSVLGVLLLYLDTV